MDAGRAYFGTKLITTGMMHHVRAPFAPRRWADLLEARARNQVAMPSPAVSGAAAIHLTALVQNPAFGFYFLRLSSARLFQNLETLQQQLNQQTASAAAPKPA